MTREEAIRHGKEQLEIFGEGCEHYEFIKMAIKALEQESKWIPVSERLPDIHNYYQDYLITDKNKLVRRAFFTDMDGKQWWSVDDVIAWMSLPEPYNVESEDKE